jgi:F0F1-type ATP synthase membrane subunit b/b'
MSQHIVTYNNTNVNELGGRFKNQKKIRNEYVSKLSTRVQKELEPEAKRLEEAIANYQKKYEKVMEYKEIREYHDTIDKYNEEMMNTVRQASKYFNQERERIKNDSRLNTVEKKKQEKELFLYFTGLFMTEEEKKMFDQMVNHEGVFFISSSPLSLF